MKGKEMNRYATIAIVTIAILSTLITGIIVTIDTAPQTIKEHGITFVRTDDNTMARVMPEDYTMSLFGNIEKLYARYTIATPNKPVMIVPSTPMTIDTPAMLPNTSSPHGAITCTLQDANGNSYTVTRESCDDL